MDRHLPEEGTLGQEASGEMHALAGHLLPMAPWGAAPSGNGTGVGGSWLRGGLEGEDQGDPLGLPGLNGHNPGRSSSASSECGFVVRHFA